MYFEDLTNNVKAVIAFSTLESKGLMKKKTKGLRDEFRGLIYQCKPFGHLNKTKDLMTRFPTDKIKDVFKLKDKDKVKDVAQIEGSWLRGLTIGGKQYWNMTTDRPCRMKSDLAVPTEQQIEAALTTFAKDASPEYITELAKQNGGAYNPVLRSDWRYREDLIWLMRDHLVFAHKWKLRNEVQQRLDRKLRKDNL